jgi:hypothetical protein
MEFVIAPHRRTKIVKDFFDKADSKNLIAYKDSSKFPEITKHIISNRKEETETFQEFNGIFQDPKKMITLSGFISKKFNVGEISTSRLISNYFIFHGLNYLENTKTILKEYVDPTKRIGKKRVRVTEGMTLNQLVTSLAQELGMAEFEELFPPHLRDVSGYSARYFKNGRLTWIDSKGNGVSVSQNEFVDLLNEFDSNFVEIVNEWTRRKNKKIKS